GGHEHGTRNWPGAGAGHYRGGASAKAGDRGDRSSLLSAKTPRFLLLADRLCPHCVHTARPPLRSVPITDATMPIWPDRDRSSARPPLPLSGQLLIRGL